MCINYRELNKLTVKNVDTHYPGIDGLFDRTFKVACLLGKIAIKIRATSTSESGKGGSSRESRISEGRIPAEGWYQPRKIPGMWKGVSSDSENEESLTLDTLDLSKSLERYCPVAINLNFPNSSKLRLDDKLNFVEEPVEIMDQEVKQLKQIRILIVKVTEHLMARSGTDLKMAKLVMSSPNHPTSDIEDAFSSNAVNRSIWD
ncbi:hypothetical protein Tco_0073278 [Tanacetum coccineum]